MLAGEQSFLVLVLVPDKSNFSLQKIRVHFFAVSCHKRAVYKLILSCLVVVLTVAQRWHVETQTLGAVGSAK